MARAQKEACETQESMDCLKDTLVSRQILVQIRTTTFDLEKSSTQVRLVSRRIAGGIDEVRELHELLSIKKIKWTLMLSEARLKLYEMEAPSLLEVLGAVEHGLRQVLEQFWLRDLRTA